MEQGRSAMRHLAVPPDTTLDIARKQYALLQRLSPGRRLAQALAHGTSIREVAISGERLRRPQLGELEARQGVVGRIIGQDLARKVRYRDGGTMTQESTLTRLADHLEAAGMPFMVVGSLASSCHGQPRSTQDIDLVIDPTPEQLDAFLARLGTDYYVDPASAREALRKRTMFNVLDLDTGWKADLIVRKDRAFSVSEFARRGSATVLGTKLPVASPEDVVLAKLEWDKITPSERQVRDALHVAIVQGESLDRDYLRKWASVLDVAAKLEEVLRLADEVGTG
jgi:hypothetical protein